jgi:hypothetical protein
MGQKYYDSIDHQVFTNGKKDSKEGISYNLFGRCKEQETQDGTSQPDTPSLQYKDGTPILLFNRHTL